MSPNLLITIILLPLLGCLFVALSRDDKSSKHFNSLYSAIWVLLTNLCLIVGLFSYVGQNEHAGFRLAWNIFPQINLLFKADLLSLLLIGAAHLAILTGLVSLRLKKTNRKQIVFFSLFYLSILNGYFCAADVLSFYVFYTFSIIPLLMQIGFSERNSNDSVLMKFFIFNGFASLVLLIAVILMIFYFKESPAISTIAGTDLPPQISGWVWGGIFAALIARLPVWPFYRWIGRWSAQVENPLVFINLNLLPACGIYGLLRFWPEDVMREVSWLIPLSAGLCVFTMLYAALRSCYTKILQEKLYDYAVVYNLLYLSGVFLPTDILQINLGYALFSFIVLLALLSAVVFHIRHEEAKTGQEGSGILCLLPRTSLIYTISVLSALGLPVTAIFWNNFIILSKIFDYNFFGGNMVMISVAVTAIALMKNLYFLKNRVCLLPGSEKIVDIDRVQLTCYWVVMLVLFLSFIKPLWFVI